MPNAQLGLTKRIRNVVADAAAQTVIAVILTTGFVLIQILAGTGLFVLDAYSPVMAWYGPLQAVVIGFYFGINIMRNNRTAQPTPDLAETMQNLTSMDITLNRISRVLVTLTSIITQLVKEGKLEPTEQMSEEPKEVTVQEWTKDNEPTEKMSEELRRIGSQRLGKDIEPEEENDSEPPDPGLPPPVHK